MDKLLLAGDEDVWARIARLRIRTLDVLAPRMRVAVATALEECHGRFCTVHFAEPVKLPLDVVVHETLRTDELQRIYFAQGTTKAETARKSWHYYGLAVDVRSSTFDWFTGKEAKLRWPDGQDRARVTNVWFAAVAEIFKTHGLTWGGDWQMMDLPHFQWKRCAASPRQSPDLYDRAGGGQKGREAVWAAVGAI